MKSDYIKPNDLEWKCLKCDQHLVVGKVIMEYLDNQFTAKLAKCPGCGIVLISEELAMGKMAEVEQLLEDK